MSQPHERERLLRAERVAAELMRRCDPKTLAENMMVMQQALTKLQPSPASLVALARLLGAALNVIPLPRGGIDRTTLISAITLIVVDIALDLPPTGTAAAPRDGDETPN